MSKPTLLNSKPVKLLIAVGGIYTSYIYFGLTMEKLFNTDYSGQNRARGTYQRFTFGFATTLFQNIFCFILAGLVNRFYYKQSKSKMDLKSEISIATCSFFSVLLAAQALSYVAFPIQAIMKSSKIISILIVSLILRIKGQHTRSQYICGFLITAGIVVFNLTSEKGGKHDQDTSIIGLVALMISLFCDGLLGVIQGEVKKKFNPTSWDQMESLNKWAAILCTIVALVSGQAMSFIEYVKEYPAVVNDIAIVSVLGTLGQVFIFYTIANFSPLLLSIVTTTRKFFTVLFSIMYFNHQLNYLQWVSIGLVFVGVFIEMFGGKGHHGKGAKVEASKEVKTVTDAKVEKKQA